MLEQQKTFGEALAEWMRASGVSTKRLAERTGYKSKTSIVRILREEGVHAGRERLLEQLRKQDLLDPAAYASLAQALEISRVGPARARGRMCLRRLLVGRRASELSPSLTQALEPLRQARSARILLLNGCRVELTEELRQILRQRPAHVMEHYVSVDFSSERAMEALCAILAIACVPAYACAIREMRPNGAKSCSGRTCSALPRRIATASAPIRSCSFPVATTARGYIRSRPPLACLTSCAAFL